MPRDRPFPREGREFRSWFHNVARRRLVPDRAGIWNVVVDLAHPVPTTTAETAQVLLDGPDRSDFLAAVFEHRLDPALAWVLTAAGAPTPAELERIIDEDRVVRLTVQSVLGVLAGALDRAGIGWVVLKGPSISRLMERPDLRAFSDLDLLVDPDRFGDALDVLGEAGAVELNRNWVPYVAHRVGETPLTFRGVTVDLHWDVIGLARVRRTMSLPPGPMVARRRLEAVGDTEVWMLDASDQLLHVALHAALGGGKRLDQLRDLAVLSVADPPPWGEFVTRCRQAGVAGLVAQPLDRARGLLGAEVPAAVVDELGARSVRIRRRIDGRTRGALRGFPVAPVRDRPLATLRAVGDRAREAMLVPLGRGGGWDFTDESGLLYFDRPSGGLAARAEFIAGVRRWARDDRSGGR